MFDRFGVGAPPLFGVRGGIVAVAVHAAILAYGLHSVTRSADGGKPYQAPDRIWVLPQAPRSAPVSLPVIAGPGDVSGVLRIPTTIPNIPGESIQPGPITMPTEPVAGPSAGPPGGVYDSSVVEQMPELLSSPPPRYPGLLRQAHVEGVVMVEGVVDTAGHLEYRTLRVVASPHPAFSASALTCLEGAVFRPGRVEGRAVRVLVQIPVRFSIAGR